LSVSELTARLVQGESTQWARIKTHALIALLKEAGDAAAAENHTDESRAFYLKGLDLLLSSVAGVGSEMPEFVPGLEVFLASLADAPLPAWTQAALMHHYEQSGAFAKAEDALFDLLDTAPGSGEAIDFGMAFYERLLGRTDEALVNGNLPRAELEAGLAELRRRKLGSAP
jgi:hypothetical protein